MKLITLSAEAQKKILGEVVICPSAEVDVKPNGDGFVYSHVEVPLSTDRVNRNAFELPYANKHLYSDAYPFEVVKRNTATKLTVREMDAERDPSWKPEMIPGGFAAHTVNNGSQRWIYTSNPAAKEIAIRWSKTKRGWFDKHGNRYQLSINPYRFHDYNF